MKEKYFYMTFQGTKAESTGTPYYMYKSGDRYVFYAVPPAGYTVLTVNVRTGPGFILYAEKRNGFIHLTEKNTGLNCYCPGLNESVSRTHRGALEAVALKGDLIASLLVKRGYAV